MRNEKIAIIGTGHMGRALFTGMIKSGVLSPAHFILTGRVIEGLQDLNKSFGVEITTDNKNAVKRTQIIILCVRPRDIGRVIGEIKEEINKSHLIISVAACVPLSLLNVYFGKKDLPLIRIIPNIPVSFQKGVVGWVGNGKITDEKLQKFKKIFSTLGFLVQCKGDEGLERLSMISGCGIGYVAYFMKNLSTVAVKYGFSENEAQKISQMVFSSTVDQLQKEKQTPDELIHAVATKGGITEEVLHSLDRELFPELFGRCIGNGLLKVKNIANDLQKEV